MLLAAIRREDDFGHRPHAKASVQLFLYSVNIFFEDRENGFLRSVRHIGRRRTRSNNGEKDRRVMSVRRSVCARDGEDRIIGDFNGTVNDLGDFFADEIVDFFNAAGGGHDRGSMEYGV